MSTVRVDFTVCKTEILYNDSEAQTSVSDKLDYLNYQLHVNPNEKDCDNRKTYFRALRLSSKGVPIIDVIPNIRDVPIGFVIRRTLNAIMKEPLFYYTPNTPLFEYKYPEGKLAKDYMCLSFIENVANEEDYVLFDFDHEILSQHEASNQQSELRWNTYKFDDSMNPRIPWNVWYTMDDDDDCFIICGGLMSTKFLPAEYFDFCVNSYSKVHPRLSRLDAQAHVAKCFFLTDDIWKFYHKENKWQLIAPPTSLSFMKVPGGRHCSALRNQMFNARATIQADRKIYFFSNNPISAKTDTIIIKLFSLDYTSNKYERVEEFDKISYKFKNYSKFYVGYDRSNGTMIFISNTLDSIIVMCLSTFNCIEFAIEAKIPPEYLDYLWHPLVCEGEGKLAIISYSTKETPLGSDKKGVEITDTIGLIDWDLVKSQRIDPFLQRCRRKTVLQLANSLLSNFF